MEELVGSSGLRGIALKDISPSLCLAIGTAISSLNLGRYAVGHDVRLSSPILAFSLALGLNAGGSDVEYVGLAPTPAVAFYSRGSSGGGMITASHNPPEYNGIKLFDSRGASITQTQYLKIAALSSHVEPAKYDSLGSIRRGGGLEKYVEAVVAASRPKKRWKVGLDPGNGSTVLTATMIYKKIGLVTQGINVAPDGTFPGRGSEPSEEALWELSELVRARSLDIGFGFDGDGDRLAIVDEQGRYIDQDAALAFFLARQIKGRKGTVVVNVDTSSAVDVAVEAAGGRIVRSRVGDPYILEAMIKHRAIAGGEAAGAWICPEISLCPDGVLSSIMFLALLEEGGMKPSEVRGKLPPLALKRKKVHCKNNMKKVFMNKLEAVVRKRYCEEDILMADGIRVGFADKSWVLIRPSGTEPAIRVTAESPSGSQTLKLMDEFVKLIMTTKEGKIRKL